MIAFSFINPTEPKALYVCNGSTCFAIDQRKILTARHVNPQVGQSITGHSLTFTITAVEYPPDLPSDTHPPPGNELDMALVTVAENIPEWHEVAGWWELGLKQGDRLTCGGWGDTAPDGVYVFDNNPLHRAEKWINADIDILSYAGKEGPSGIFCSFKAKTGYGVAVDHDSGGLIGYATNGKIYAIGIIRTGVPVDGNGNGVAVFGDVFGGPAFGPDQISWIRSKLSAPRDRPQYAWESRTFDGTEVTPSPTAGSKVWDGLEARGAHPNPTFPINNPAICHVTDVSSPYYIGGSDQPVYGGFADAGGSPPVYPPTTLLGQIIHETFCSVSAPNTGNEKFHPVTPIQWFMGDPFRADGITPSCAYYGEAGGTMSTALSNAQPVVSQTNVSTTTLYVGEINDYMDGAYGGITSWIVGTGLAEGKLLIRLSAFRIAQNALNRYDARLAGMRITVVVARADYNTLGAPTVTDAGSCKVDALSQGGLVLTPNASDTSTLTHFEISDMQPPGGTLYLADGVTPAGNFPTKAQGAAGLRYRPPPNFLGTASFKVRSANAANSTSVGGASRRCYIQVASIGNTTGNLLSPAQATLLLKRRLTIQAIMELAYSDKDHPLGSL